MCYLMFRLQQTFLRSESMNTTTPASWCAAWTYIFPEGEWWLETGIQQKVSKERPTCLVQITMSYYAFLMIQKLLAEKNTKPLSTVLACWIFPFFRLLLTDRAFPTLVPIGSTRQQVPSSMSTRSSQFSSQSKRTTSVLKSKGIRFKRLLLPSKMRMFLRVRSLEEQRRYQVLLLVRARGPPQGASAMSMLLKSILTRACSQWLISAKLYFDAPNSIQSYIDILSMILTLLSTAVESLLGGLDEARWALWKHQHHQTFQAPEDSFRKSIFLKNLEMIESHNSNPSATYKMALNQFAALSADQFHALYLNSPSQTYSSPLQSQEDFKVPQNLKGDINWNAAGYVTAVKNQGQCASGYAFGVTGALQFYYKLKTGNLISLSEQQIVDCDTLDQGCNGGFVVNGLNYTRVVGLASAASYPYIASKQICKSTTPVVKNTNLITVTECQALYNALQNRTVAVMVDARNFQFYSSGVFNNCTSSITHGVLLVGVATNSYWYVKNEWTTSWGEYGYIRIAWGNTCGICSYGAYPL